MKVVCMQYMGNLQGSTFSMFGDGKPENMLLARATSIIFSIHCFHSYCFLLISSLATRGGLSNAEFTKAENLAGDRARSTCLFAKCGFWLIQSIYAKNMRFHFYIYFHGFLMFFTFF